jgi:lysophospholipase L1-like esterase
MKKQILKFIIALTSANVLFAAPLHSAIDPVPRTDQGWVTRQDAFNKKVLEVGERAEVIFIGDSITQGWEGAGREAWEKHFAKYNAINLGIGGDRTQHVLYRLENGNLKGLKPKAAVVMIGTNNSNGEDNTVEQIADGITAIVQKLRDRLPETKILLIPIFPRGENPNPQRGKINQVNQIIQKLADDRHVLWVDFGHKYLNSDGTIPRDLMPDYLHLSPKAYAIWAESIAEPLALAVGNKVSAAVTDAELSGDWIATMPGPEQEPVDVPFTLKKEGAKLSGSFKGADGRDLPIENGKIDGNQLSWTVKRTRPEGGVMTYRMNGIVEGNRIRGRAATELEGATIAIDWSARRK